jgi:hypothetical protein
MNEPMITKRGLLSMQVCVPKEWDDFEVINFSEKENPCGTTNGWFIRKEGDEKLAGCAERVQCNGRTNCVHIMLDA